MRFPSTTTGWSVPEMGPGLSTIGHSCTITNTEEQETILPAVEVSWLQLSPFNYLLTLVVSIKTLRETDIRGTPCWKDKPGNRPCFCAAAACSTWISPFSGSYHWAIWFLFYQDKAEKLLLSILYWLSDWSAWWQMATGETKENWSSAWSWWILLRNQQENFVCPWSSHESQEMPCKLLTETGAETATVSMVVCS